MSALWEIGKRKRKMLTCSEQKTIREALSIIIALNMKILSIYDNVEITEEEWDIIEDVKSRLEHRVKGT
jgi:hypothetical protein